MQIAVYNYASMLLIVIEEEHLEMQCMMLEVCWPIGNFAGFLGMHSRNAFSIPSRGESEIQEELPPGVYIPEVPSFPWRFTIRHASSIAKDKELLEIPQSCLE